MNAYELLGGKDDGAKVEISEHLSEGDELEMEDTFYVLEDGKLKIVSGENR